MLLFYSIQRGVGQAAGQGHRARDVRQHPRLLPRLFHQRTHQLHQEQEELKPQPFSRFGKKNSQKREVVFQLFVPFTYCPLSPEVDQHVAILLMINCMFNLMMISASLYRELKKTSYFDCS